jgi:mannose-6-phosphate isomerase-like protein (cupin superfamily)
MNDKSIITNTKSAIHYDGLDIQLKLTAQDTSGTFSIVEFRLEPKTLGTPVHMHHREDVFLSILAGSLVVQIETQIHTMKCGQWVKIPRDTAFATWNLGDVTSRYLEIVQPAGFEQKYLEMNEILKSGEPIQFETVQELEVKYGSETDFQSIFDLSELYGLQFDQRFQSICW